MFYTYVLLSKKDGEFYTGSTKNLNARIEQHNSGKNYSTKSRLPLGLVYYEWCMSDKDARAREKYLKSGMGKRFIRNRLKFFLKNERP